MAQDPKPKKVVLPGAFGPAGAADDSALQAATTPANSPALEGVDLRPGWTWGDLGRAPLRGVEMAVKGVVDTADLVIPGDWGYGDYKTPDPKSQFGDVAASIVDFATAFIPIAGAVGRTGQIGKALKLTKGAVEATEGVNVLQRSASYLSKGNAATTRFGQMVAGAATAFVADPVEFAVERQNDWTIDKLASLGGEDWKAAIHAAFVAKEDDPAILKRLKNTAMGFAMGSLADAAFWGARAMAGRISGLEAGAAAKDILKKEAMRQAEIQKALDSHEMGKKLLTMEEARLRAGVRSEAQKIWESQEFLRKEKFAADQASAVAQAEKNLGKIQDAVESGGEALGKAEAMTAPEAEWQKTWRYFKYLDNVEAIEKSGKLRFSSETRHLIGDDVAARIEGEAVQRLTDPRIGAIPGGVTGQIDPRKLSFADATIARVRAGDLNTRMLAGGRPMIEVVRSLETTLKQVFDDATERAILDDDKLAPMAAAIGESLDNLRQKYTGSYSTQELSMAAYKTFELHEAILAASAKQIGDSIDNALTTGDGLSTLLSKHNVDVFAALLQSTKDYRSGWGYIGQGLQKKVVPSDTGLERFLQMLGKKAQSDAEKLVALEDKSIQKRLAAAERVYRKTNAQLSKEGIAKLSKEEKLVYRDLLDKVKGNTAQGAEAWKAIRKNLTPDGQQSYLAQTMDAIFSGTRFTRDQAEWMKEIMQDPMRAEQILTWTKNNVTPAVMAGDVDAIERALLANGGGAEIRSKLREMREFIRWVDSDSVKAEKIAKVLENMDRPGALAMSSDFFVNQLLDSGRTIFRATVSSTAMGGIVQPIARMTSGLAGMGAAKIAGDKIAAEQFAIVAKTGVGQLMREMNPQLWVEAGRAAKVGWTQNRDVLAGAAPRVNKLTYDNLRNWFADNGINPDGLMPRAITWFATRAPGEPFFERTGLGFRLNFKGGLGVAEQARWGGRALGAFDQGVRYLVQASQAKARLQAEAEALFPMAVDTQKNYVTAKFEKILKDGEWLSRTRLEREAKELVADQRFREMRGITTKAQQDEFVKNHIEEQWAKHADESSIAAWADGNARRATAQEELDPQSLGGMWQRAVGAHPLLGYLSTFFVRPTVNLGKQAFAPVTDAIGLARIMSAAVFKTKGLEDSRLQLVRQLYSNDAFERAEAMGRLAFSTALIGTAVQLAGTNDENGEPIIWGNPPKNEGIRKFYESHFGKEIWNTVKIGDSRVSTRGFEPFSSIFTMATDVATVNRYLRNRDSQEWTDIVLGTVAATASNAVSTTFASGIKTAFESILEGDASKWLSSIVPPMVPGYWQRRMMSDIANELEGDTKAREVHGMVDRIKARLGMDNDLEVQWDVFGEDIDKGEYLGPDFVSAVRYLSPQRSPATIEMYKLGVSLTPPDDMYRGIDMLQLRNAKGVSAYRRYGELVRAEDAGQGKGIRQYVEDLIKSPEFQMNVEGQALYGIKTARRQQLEGAIHLYHASAFEKLKDEFPELRAQDEKYQAERARVRTPVVGGR